MGHSPILPLFLTKKDNILGLSRLFSALFSPFFALRDPFSTLSTLFDAKTFCFALLGKILLVEKNPSNSI